MFPFTLLTFNSSRQNRIYPFKNNQEYEFYEQISKLNKMILTKNHRFIFQPTLSIMKTKSELALIGPTPLLP